MERRHDAAHGQLAPHLFSKLKADDLRSLSRLAYDDDVSYEMLVEVLQFHPLVGSVLRRAASSIGVGAGQPIRSMRHALAILGLARIRATLDQLVVNAEENSRIAS